MSLHITDLAPVQTQPVSTRFRRIMTAIPVPESIPEIERLRRVEPESMAGMPPILWDSAEGYLVRDAYGNQWIDLSSGIVVANVGHAHPAILAAIRKQLDSRLVFSYAFSTAIRRQLLEKLVALGARRIEQSDPFFRGHGSDRMRHQPHAKARAAHR